VEREAEGENARLRYEELQRENARLRYENEVLRREVFGQSDVISDLSYQNRVLRRQLDQQAAAGERQY
jgi:hypothetical protein